MIWLYLYLGVGLAWGGGEVLAEYRPEEHGRWLPVIAVFILILLWPAYLGWKLWQKFHYSESETR